MAPAEPVGFRFGGNGGELFRIWIANLFLTIVTLGIYSAWAKVRTNRYFWGNTHLGGTSFDYRANPLSILKGRLLVLVFLAAYGGVSVFWPMADAPFGLLFVAFIPWAIVRSLTFRARNSSYRNIRFDFRGRYAAAWPQVRISRLAGLVIGRDFQSCRPSPNTVNVTAV